MRSPITRGTGQAEPPSLVAFAAGKGDWLGLMWPAGQHSKVERDAFILTNDPTIHPLTAWRNTTKERWSSSAQRTRPTRPRPGRSRRRRRHRCFGMRASAYQFCEAAAAGSGINGRSGNVRWTETRRRTCRARSPPRPLGAAVSGRRRLDRQCEAPRSPPLAGRRRLRL
jgi:hypothetical protein